MQNIHIDISGHLEWQGKKYKCAVGKEGIISEKKEGDGTTPAGCFPIREVWYRKDRVEEPKSVFKAREITDKDGWSNDPTDPDYNKHVSMPHNFSAETLWRDDNLYDIVVVLGYNDDPVLSGKGSAIFMHIAQKNYSPTQGCVVLSEDDLREILATVAKDTLVCIS